MAAWSPRANEIFLAAADIVSPQERELYLDQACGDDAELRSAVDVLLRAGARAARSGFLESPAHAIPSPTAVQTAAAFQPHETIGTVIGNYKLLERIGEGGFGVVFMAEQLRPVHRRVAVKIIKPGMDSAQVIARFEAERQAVALMDHPNIAKVLDAGTTDAGRPYFVMDLVKGVPITRYCDQEQLSPHERLQLFIPVCQAVQHAHQKGVIHRDLKPSNVLIALYDGRPVPKVIDFGVAKAIGQKLTERTMFTEIGSIVGTLEYMAPEQAELNNLDIDTRSDIYSLGVILYELLTGSPPFTGDQLRGAAFDQMLRMIREVEPPKPSTRLSNAAELPSIAAKRKLEPKRLTRLVHGELDWIAMKALEKERTRRYETANGLAMDLQRYLADEAVSAGPPSPTYRLRKFVRRHRAPVFGAALVALLLVGGVTGTTIGLVEARAQRDEARKQRLEAERANENTQAVNDFVTDKVLGAADPKVSRGREVSVKEALDKAAEKVHGMFADRPLIEAEVRNTLATTYHSLGRADIGLPHAQAALDIRRRLLGNEHSATLASVNNLGALMRTLGRSDEAEALWREAANTGRRTLGPEHPNTTQWTFNLAHQVEDRGDNAQAEQLLVAALAARRRTLGDDHPDTLNSINDLSLLRQDQGKLDESEALARESLEGYRRVLGPDHPFTLASLHNMATLLILRGRPADAEPFARQAVEGSRRAAGPNHPRTLMFRTMLGYVLFNAGKFAEAETELIETERLLATMPGVPLARHRNCVETLVNMYRAWDKAEPRKGHDLAAQSWKAKLPSARPATSTSPSP